MLQKKMGEMCPKECPFRLRAVPQCLTSSPQVHSGVCLTVSSSKGNCGPRGSYLRGQREKETAICRKKRPFSILDPPLTPRLCFHLHLQVFCIFHFWFLTVKAEVDGLQAVEGLEILKNKLTVCHGLEKRRWFCGFSQFDFIVIQQVFTECLLGADSVPGALMYQLQSWAHSQRYRIEVVMPYCWTAVTVPLYRREH